jgi:uncharacterized damage-inducible protein DinB
MSVPVTTLINHFDYTIWATEKILDSVHQLNEEELHRDLGVSHHGVLQTLQHIYYADRVWLSRLSGRPIASFADDGDGPDLTELSAIWPALLKEFRDYIEGLTDAANHEQFSYRNLQGLEMTLRRWQAILHVVNHASIHRGQVVAMLRQLDKQPPSTDLVYFYLR